MLLAYAACKLAHEYIFTRPTGVPLDDRDLQRNVFRPAAEAVGIYHERFSMHVFRRAERYLAAASRSNTRRAPKGRRSHFAGYHHAVPATEAQHEREHVGKILERLGVAKAPTSEVELLQ